MSRVKTSYDISELAELFGEDRRTTLRMLRAAGVPLRRVDPDNPRSKLKVWLSDLRTHMGHAWLSVQERLQITKSLQSGDQS